MCIAIYKPKNKLLTRKILKRCWDANGNGAGFMYAYNNHLYIKKGYFSFCKFYSDYRKAENKHNTDFVIHFRFATHGRINKANCHPLAVNESLAFVHNGIFRTMPINFYWSDSAMFRSKVICKLPFNWLKNPALIALIEDYCLQSSSKLVFMSSAGIVKIFNEQAGIWDSGVWFSNNGYKPVTNWYLPDMFDNFDGDIEIKENPVMCGFCEGIFSEDETESVGSGEIYCKSCIDILYNKA